MAAPVPVQQRIELAEAFIELQWLRVCAVPPSRGGIIEDARHRKLRAEQFAPIDAMLDRLLPLYDQRALLAATEAS